MLTLYAMTYQNRKELLSKKKTAIRHESGFFKIYFLYQSAEVPPLDFALRS